MPGLSMFSPAPYHILSYGTLLGTTFFHTFPGSLISYQTLARPQFAALMTNIFPVYFSMQTALPLVMALTYPGRGIGAASGISGVLHSSNRWSVFIPLLTTFSTALLNLAIVGPATTKCMETRRMQERKDGKKNYDPPPHSQEMVALNKQFSILHGISSLLNLGSFIASVAYGFEIAARLS